jgi:ketosteroid isomerase-like protein
MVNRKTVSKNRALIACGIVCAFGVASTPVARADQTSDARAAIQSAYNDQNAGYASQNVKAILSHTAPDFAVLGGGRVVPKPMIAEGLTQVLTRMNGFHGHIQRTTSIEKIDVKGGQATVLTRVKVQVTGIDAHTGKPRTQGGGGTMKDVWARTKGQWLEKSEVKLSGTG